ncbi:MAG: hypothetical protein RL605_154 [Actinomycetota bacterium]|jgi:predicted transcriptional regulator
MTRRARQQGELEAAILDVLWGGDTPLSSGQVLDAVNKATGSELALTTVLTVLGRLVDKGLAVRTPAEGRGNVFTAATTREQHTASVMLELFAGTENPALAFSHFASGLSPEVLKQLRRSLGD